MITGKIFYIIGMSCCGKTTLYNDICSMKDFTYNHNLKPLIQHTTRPKRDNEVDGVDYHFVNDIEFDNLLISNKFIEFREYDTVNGEYRYATAYESIDMNYNYIASGSDMDAYINISKVIGKENVIPIFLYADDKTIINRLFSRCNTRMEYKEACRRYISDIDRYSLKSAKHKYHIPEENCFTTTDSFPVVKVLKLIIDTLVPDA